MNSESEPSRMIDLATRYLDHALSEAETKEFDRLICEDEGSIDWAEEILAQACELAESAAPNTGSEDVRDHPAGQKLAVRISSPWFWIPTAMAAAFAMFAGIQALSEKPVPPIATITFEGREGRLGRVDESELVQIVSPGEAQGLASGQWFRIGGMDGAAELVFEDQTRVQLYQKAEAVVRIVNGQKILELREGQISAEVTPQKTGRPFLISTPSSRLEVLGTELEVSASAQSTDLVVTHGRVAMIRSSDGAQVEVGAGQRATVDSGAPQPLTTSTIPQLPSEWVRDFSEEPGATWGGGKWQPEGTMLAYPRFDLGYSHFAVVSNNAWADGLHSHFQVHPDSYLELRFKMKKPQWFIIRLGLRGTPDSVRKFGGNAFYQNNQWHRELQPEEWRTLRIPLSEVHHFSRSKSNDVNLNGLGAYLISISTQRQDAGLVIDAIRVGRGAMDEEEK